MKKLLITLIKIGLSAAIMAYLIYNATQTGGEENAFENLRAQPKDWGLLLASLVVCTTAVVLTLLRWWMLVRTLDIPCSLNNALRIGFVGYMFNLAPLGIVGGDLLKAWMLAQKGQRGDRAKAFASVVLDRIIGLYMLFVVASGAILLTGLWRLPQREIRYTCLAVFAATLAGGLFIALLLTPGLTEGRLTRRLGRIRRVGPVIENVIDAVRMYRRNPTVLAAAAVMSIGVHCLFAVGVYLIACGLPGDVLSLSAHFVAWPLASAGNAVPLPMGPAEAVLDFLYANIPESGVIIPAGQGLVVALCYRLITVMIAAIGMGYYFTSRQEVARAIHDAEQQP